jgi:uncharacterized membrane protein HdeD (DUF308 family)
MDPNQLERYEAFYGVLPNQNNWTWFLGIGIALIILGILAVGGSVFVTLASVVFFGSLLLIGGVVQTVNAFKTRHGSGFFLSLLSGILYFVVGGLLILHPAVGAITLTLLLAAFYSASGLFKMIAAVTQRFSHWGWVFFSGAVSLLLGILIWSQWPFSGLWVIGLFIGIDLIVLGWMWVALALQNKSLTPPSAG